ncbi:MAG: hypothetical protein ACXAAH_01635 [Promethearchaeota archaeon]
MMPHWVIYTTMDSAYPSDTQSYSYRRIYDYMKYICVSVYADALTCASQSPT